ncbi:MAG: hypothetical protein IJ311_03920 [Elusimicrobiaceae bacterium]|nr:hypothetical protein [Elusimicrobiaceae bacterium]
MISSYNYSKSSACTASCAGTEFICYNMDMEKERLMALLRNPQKFQKKAERKQQADKVKQDRAEKAAAKAASEKMMLVVGSVVAVMVVVSLIFVLSAQKRVHNLSASLDPAVLKGLMVDKTFNPNNTVRYVQISEGADRNVSNVVEYGSTLPVISRYNYKALPPKSLKVIGAAPYALSINVSSNISDPDLLHYLFNQQEVIDEFLKRPDVAPLLSDPKALTAVATDIAKTEAFFNDETVQKVLADPKLLHALASSRLFSYMLISKAVKYYRDNPALASQLIHASPVLTSLKNNPNVRKEVSENAYLKKIAVELLK